MFWGIRDFRHRFSREPEGMMAARDRGGRSGNSRHLLAQHGIHHTRVLAPSQAKSMEGEDVNGARIDPTRAYKLNLSSGRSINLFFYDGPISRAVAFEGLLNNGEDFARRLLTSFSRPAAIGRNSRILPPTAKPTAITIDMGIWR